MNKERVKRNTAKDTVDTVQDCLIERKDMDTFSAFHQLLLASHNRDSILCVSQPNPHSHHTIASQSLSLSLSL